MHTTLMVVVPGMLQACLNVDGVQIKTIYKKSGGSSKEMYTLNCVCVCVCGVYPNVCNLMVG